MSEQQAIENKFCEVLKRTEDYILLMERISKQMKKGYFELAQAKYSMGTTSLSSCSYDNEMIASQRLIALNNDDCNCTEWELSSNLLNNKSSEDSSAVKDPVRWFGVMVPTALTNSQESFKSVIPLIVEIANHARYINLATKELTSTEETTHEEDKESDKISL